MTPQEALDRIAALLRDDTAHVGTLRGEDVGAPGERVYTASTLRAVLAEVSPEPGGTLDRDQARDVLAPWLEDATDLGWQNVLDALALCVRPAAIDRDALIRKIDYWAPDVPSELVGQFADAILALVRPVAGVTLTPEEAAMLRKVLSRDPRTEQLTADENGLIDALAARLEGSS